MGWNRLGLALAVATGIGLLGARVLWAESVVGNGRASTQVRTVEGFERITLAGAAEIAIEIGPVFKVEVESDENLLPLIVTEVRDRTLEITTRGNYRTKLGTHLRLTLPKLTAIESSGSGAVSARGLAGGSLDTRLSGSGDLTLAGRAEQLTITVAGSGSIHAEGLEAKQVEVQISGSGVARVHARETLKASISGSGEIRYRGTPKVERKISGSGVISPL